MAALTGWITNIVLFILLATIIDLLLPNSNLQKYAKLVIGLLLMLIIITPIFQVFKVDVDKLLVSMNLTSNDEEQKMKNVIELKKKEIQASHRAYTLEQMAVQMETGVKEELMEQYGVAIDHIHIETAETTDTPTPENINESIRSIHIVISEDKEESESEVVSAVKVVSIDTSKPMQVEKQHKETSHISAYLANKWGIDLNKVTVNLEEGLEENE
ncbi:stage III sporulation protein AF [Metabacillus iocasae]|uniref:Stage III sporulation protein AF n=1 Tax=Priestia iocasae TaxID=2291674 RepID=A0ABS2QQ45_9BACI|nr:stage III sporulation protein AF [Metabacillus iocasae]MBM7701579.1 stage III sporulation protein AF [Metabacillus iocasae]